MAGLDRHGVRVGRRLDTRAVGNSRRMDDEEAEPDVESVDEQLGSPGWTFEKGWLAGLALGLAALVVVGRRRARRRRVPAHEEGQP